MNRAIGQSRSIICLPVRPASGEAAHQARWRMVLRRIPIARGLLLLLAVAPPLHGQVPMTPRGLGVSGALVGTARGLDALFVNPANLALAGAPRWTLGLPQATIAGTVAGPSLGDLVNLLDRDALSPADKDRIFGAVPAAGAEGRLDARVPVLGFQRERVAVAVSYGAVGEHGIARDVFDLALYGYQPGRIDYRAEGTAGSMITYWDIAAAYGDRTGAVSWGVTAHYLRGRTALRSWVTEPRFDLSGSDIEADYVSVILRGGHGFALDVGAAYEPRPGLTLSAAIANALGTMSWSDDLYIRNVRLNAVTVEDEIGALLDRHRDSERLVGPADADLTRGITARTLQDGAYLPTTARLGLGWQPVEGTQLGASYYGAVTGGRMSGSWGHLLALGVEQRVPLITVRAGAATSFDGGSMLSGGLTVGVLDLGVARVTDHEFHTATRSGWIGAAGLTVRVGSSHP
jgi:hypothetical protein